MKLNENNRGAIALKTTIFLMLLVYGVLAGYKLTMTHFTKTSIAEQARDMINRYKTPTVYNKEKMEEELYKVLENNNVYENEEINQAYVQRTDDGRWVDYELSYRIRTDLLFFKTKYENIKIEKRSDVNKSL